MGSSPLARGLPTRSTWDPTIRRIIPARAGFTGRRCRPRDQSRDHPRSRGVYTSWYRPGSPKEGSSPLARGLPLRITTIRPPTRIIPARAGFTSPHHHHQTSNEDHPRSRGVYGDGPADVGPALGSSPLARGLPDERGAQPHEVRIIPARAGFTDPLLARHPSRRDHPRSRGVYVRVAVGGHVLGGIIPARAGFTAPVRHRADDRQDHPRSRGVYLVQTVSLTVDRWIIPARAGFTRRGRTRR